MRRHCSYIMATFFILLGAFSLGQDTVDTILQKPVEKTPTTNIVASSLLEYGSTNMNNEFIEKLIFGGKIDPSLKDKALDKINNKGRSGVEVNYKVKYTNLKDTLFHKLPNYNYYIGFGSYTNVSTSYSKDLFSTVFYGNKQFENQTAKLGGSSYISTKFEKITFGLTRKNKNTSYGVSLIIGDRLNSFNFRQADMFTQTDGTKISMDYDGKIQFSGNQKNIAFMSFSGTGLGLDYSTVLFGQTLKVTNLGFTIWFKNTFHSDASMQYDFEGAEIDNLLQIKADELELNAREILPELKEKPFVTMLPTIINIHNEYNSEKKIQMIYEVRYRFLSNYTPAVNLGAVYKVNEHMFLKGSAGYGGYAKLKAQVGAYFNYTNFTAGIESQNVTGFFMKNGNGNGLRLFVNTTF